MSRFTKILNNIATKQATARIQPARTKSTRIITYQAKPSRTKPAMNFETFFFLYTRNRGRRSSTIKDFMQKIFKDNEIGGFNFFYLTKQIPIQAGRLLGDAINIENKVLRLKG